MLIPRVLVALVAVVTLSVLVPATGAAAAALPSACGNRSTTSGDVDDGRGPVECGRPTALPKGFVRLSEVAPDILQEMRYAQDHNFVGRRVNGYESADCWLTRPAARALATVQAQALLLGYTLKVYDCYRPQRAVDDFVAWAADPTAAQMQAEFYPRIDKSQIIPLGLVAIKSGHTRGSTVDLTLVPKAGGVSPAWRPGQPLLDCAAPAAARFPDTSIDMGTGFDCFDPLAATQAPGLADGQRANRRTLLELMSAAGFVNYPLEWWHYTLAGEPYPTTYFTAPIRP